MRHFLVLTLASLIIAASAVGVRADNQTIADSIATGLSEQFPNEDITVQVQGGKVWLGGEVASASEMFKMIQFVSEMKGVKLVENEMTLSKATVTPATGNLPRVEKTEIVQTAVSRPVQRGAQAASMPPVRQASRVPVRTAPVPMIVSTSDLEEYEIEETIVQTSVHTGRQPARALQTVPMQNRIVSHVEEGEYLDMERPRGVQPVTYVNRGPRDYVIQEDEQMIPVSGMPRHAGHAGGVRPNLPKYAWPSYAAHPNYAQVTYPKYYKANTWPNIGPFYPYPQPPLGWRKTTLEWHDGKWWLDFDDGSAKGPFSPLFRSR